MALEWIAENIGHFGGDRHNVTLMGESAGGMAADLLALSPHSRGNSANSIKCNFHARSVSQANSDEWPFLLRLCHARQCGGQMPRNCTQFGHFHD
jgi:carboxylesterase type B